MRTMRRLRHPRMTVRNGVKTRVAGQVSLLFSLAGQKLMPLEKGYYILGDVCRAKPLIHSMASWAGIGRAIP